jgi:putative membrane-bound dehydrogenase-like protein
MRCLLGASVSLVIVSLLGASPPAVRDPNLVLQLVASEPQVVTPTGIAVDRHGRIWCLENHTHQRSTDYQGPVSDRLRVFEDFEPNGKARKAWTFADGFKDAMGLTLGPDGAIYVATRAAIFRLHVENDKEVSRKAIVKLETPGNYPHNGLCGFTWDGAGNLVFGLGENLGEPYRLIGSDGTTLSGGGEGGSMYRCRPDGTGLERLATGFWNPFAHCFNRQGHLFAVDNDPDARGPCRLLHVVPGGDYGYRFRYGRKGLHPFNSWNGELPGTLPMVAGTSEAPSGIIAADFTGLPAIYQGQLIVTSWGDHTIEAFTLTRRGASYSAQSRIVVQGDENFRPVAIAAAPDGSIVFSDWVDRSYPVHGKGRIWRLKARENQHATNQHTVAKPPSWTEKQALAFALGNTQGPERADAIRALRDESSLMQIVPLLGDSDPFIVSAAATALGHSKLLPLIRQWLSNTTLSPAVRLGLLVTLRRIPDSRTLAELPRFLDDPDPAVRRAAIQWAAEENVRELRAQIQQSAFRQPVTRELIEAWAKAEEMLAGAKTQAEEADVALVKRVLENPSIPDSISVIALRMIPPQSPALSDALLIRYYTLSSDNLARESARSLLLRRKSEYRRIFQEGLRHRSLEVRRWTVAALANYADQPDVTKTLLALLEVPELRIDALRSLRGLKEAQAGITQWWQQLAKNPQSLPDHADLAEEVEYALTGSMQEATGGQTANNIRERLQQLDWDRGDPEAGERVFFHPRGPGCAKCHPVGACGAAIGPDLSLVGRSMTPERLVESIFDPNREVAPAFVSWEVVTRDGRQFIGMILNETHDSHVALADSQGRVLRIPRTEIEEKRAIKQSIMPQDIATRMTRREFRDLLAFLRSCK